MPTTTYREFIEQKVNLDKTYGHHINPEDIHPILKPHQRDIVRWAVQGGRRAIFAAHETEKMHYRVPTATGDRHWWHCRPNPKRGRP